MRTLRVCLVEWILKRTEKKLEKMREKTFLVGVSPPKCFLPKIGRKLGGDAYFLD